ncbi:hypothetical protein NPIL_324811 [Nephila pilipes]|uniref:Methyltransferase domain-containing protein n=1 Tax=Nephila pilipes TaxID=299642 RepID=A0A8X6TIQ0_NEPPI|nr:hypothetical protein NPIL_324811 [Nephila pilipes]
MSMSLEAARTFIRRCQTELKWDNLSNVTVMDVGCGYFLECCTVLLEQFPDVEKVIGLDSDVRVFGSKLSNEVVEKFKEKIQFQNSNIEIRFAFPLSFYLT